MNYKIYKLYFRTGLRNGEGNLESNSVEIPSDILFSAIVNEAAAMDLEICENLIANFKNRSLKISDAFPFIEEEYLLPKPLISFKNNTGELYERKLYKKIKHIPISNFSEFVNGNSNPEEILKKTKNLGKNQVDSKFRDNGDDSEIYSISYFRFNENAGLYFILGFENNLDAKFEEILTALSFTGIGGRKTSGLGGFEIEKRNLPEEFQNKIDTENAKMLISTSMAKETELEKIDENANYSLLRRGGFIYSEDRTAAYAPTKRKRTMHFFKSGSIFNRQFDGDIFRVEENFVHPVYRYGVAMWLEVR